MLTTYKFDHVRQMWDDFGAFYNNYQGFIILSTGERFYTNAAPKPDNRHFYRELGVTITATTDDDCPDLYHEGRKVPKAWLTQGGSQYLAIDHEHNRAVGLMKCARYGRGGRHSHTTPPAGHEGIPSHLHYRYAVYWGGEHALPLGKPITISKPLTITKEQQQKLRALKDQIAAWLGLHDQLDAGWSHIKIDGKLYPNVGQISVRHLLDKTITDLSTQERITVHKAGWIPARDTIDVPYLTIKS